MARIELDKNNLSKFVTDVFDGSIEQYANYVNTRLTEFIVENYKYISNIIDLLWTILIYVIYEQFIVIMIQLFKKINSLEDGLYIQEYKKNNKYENFTIKYDIISARLDNTKCLNGKFNIISIALESKKYHIQVILLKTYQNNQFTLEVTGKCLYTINSQNERMIEYPKDYCFDGSTVNFETNKNKFSEWYIEGMNN
ncbi:hypothetical protein LY90DRAFT_504552 [Neocallimastix californiae]|uniref:Uncharacterized protein n=1 Tax=Neocallimastix californiae TaxID=1754190 RepID=A0A1Y2E8I2_9FUNG|nr:hypothetical protein LY90DRAFT_504552 [Neocallimastix californiae]|eukprot:ORY67868.1 hypothetical protein LY90DRAFT_504552 [Neocallimastix californiae]